MTRKAISVWLRPVDDDDKLTTLIRRLAAEHSTPPFPPHVTVVGDGEVFTADALRRLMLQLRDQKSLKLTAYSVDHTSEYHKCVFFVCNKTPSLLALRATCGQTVSYDTNHAYIPHLSAVYGHLSSDTRASICDDLALLLPLNLSLTRVSIVNTTGDDPRHWSELFEPIQLRF